MSELLREESTLQRFERKIERITESGCWIWVGALSSNGYGSFQYQGARIGAHVAAFKMFNGPLEAGKEVCHRCDIRCCVNPSHLFQGSRSVNMKDCSNKGRSSYSIAKLSYDEVIAIRNSTERNRDLVKKYEVSPSIICRARKGLHYKKPYKNNQEVRI